jgi:chromosome segregation protein
MFLKRLEIVGFKSFAERIGIDFVPGVTAVVGPNGSGKSNVTDAIRWVLGEQSAKSLRGAKMEDVIFSGSESRKPLNFAEVTLVLDNEDERIAIPYTEINVTRRVYRSGDSEYLLNNQQCRLKDITDLFMDSGLGKEAFSIISQGRVDEILNSRPEDRRSIFEEAAGVLKYKLRKKKAEHKLIETDDNLNRVLDILHEIETRLEPLKIQASAAKDYERMTTELKDFDIALMVHDLQLSKEALVQANDAFQKMNATEQEKSKVIAALENQMRTIRQNLKAIDDVLDTSQEQLVEATAEVERWEGRKQLVKERKSNAAKALEQMQLQLAEANALVAQLQASLDEKKAQFIEKQQEVQSIKGEIKQLDQALNRSASEIEAEIEQNKNRYIDCLNEEATIKNDLKHIEQQLIMQQESAAKMTDRSQEMNKELEEITTQLKFVTTQLHNAEKAVSEQVEKYNILQVQLKTASTEFEEKQGMLYKAYQHLQQLKGRKETLAELEADFSGFFQGVKEVLLARDKGELQGIEGAVAELIQVENQYSQAIETALGAASQHIVTKTEVDAQKAIGWLKQRRAGRATFLPKNVMKSRKIFDQQISQVKSHPAFVSVAYEIVQFDEMNRSIIENLLGNVLVAKELKGAGEIARLLGYKYRVVTLEGDIVNAGGSLTGGTNKTQSTLFTRKAELEQLVTTINEMETSIQTAEHVVKTKKDEISEMRHQLEAFKLKGEELREQEQVLKQSALELEMKKKSIEATFSITTSEQSSYSNRKESLLAQKEELQTRLKALVIDLASINEKVEQLTLAKANSETEKDVLREQSAQLRSQLAVASEQMVQVQTATADFELQYTKAVGNVQKLVQEIEWIENGEDVKGPSVEEIEKTVQEWQTKRDTLTTIISEKRDERYQLQQSVTLLEEQLTEHQRQHKGFVNELRSIEVKKARIELEMTTIYDQLLENYELDEEEALEHAMEIEDVDQVRRKVKLLKQSIEELGPVNLTAIEEFERVEERHQFLTEQRTDLLEAQETLHDAIKEMDEEMTIRFTETFTMIRAQFKIAFRELFGGGQADLVCIDPTNMLETGIEIIAQPPGKKLQNLSLLSGGERALTAIALLFAILNTRPVPFCILDEVEAALDESNVTRYSEYLRKFSEQTQFIVITHRKGTMEGADVLYGITMQESGVSKLVSVKLEEEAALVK